MKKKLISALFVFLASASMANAEQYLQASSTITQCPGMAPEVVEIDVTDAASGLTLTDNRITVSESGTLSDSRRASGRGAKARDRLAVLTFGCG